MLIANIQLILAGVLIGLLTAAPVGPVNVMCIQRTLERGFFAGFAAGLGAVIGDGLIALAGAFGINAISDLMVRNDLMLRIVGSAVLIAFGLKLLFTAPVLDKSGQLMRESAQDGLWAYVWTIPQTFFLTITNPGAVLGMFLMVGGAGSAIGGLNSVAEALTLGGDKLAVDGVLVIAEHRPIDNFLNLFGTPSRLFCRLLEAAQNRKSVAIFSHQVAFHCR